MSSVPAQFGNVTWEAFEAKVLSGYFKDFVKAAWGLVDPDPLVWGWHMDAVCEHLQAVSAGQIKNLLINIPPGMSKSLLTSVMWPSWEWTTRPEGRWMLSSYDQILSSDHNATSRQLVQSPWYQNRWPTPIITDQNQKSFFENASKGWRLATSVKGHALGRHPDRIVLDDLQDATGAASETERRTTKEWVRGTLATRGAGRDARIVAIMQRLDPDDIAAYFLELGFEHLMLPMKYEPNRAKTTVLGFKDKRTKAGELLDPARYGAAIVESMEAKMGPHKVAAQLQQRPTAAGGKYIKEEWIRFWMPKGSDFPIQHTEAGLPMIQVELPETWDQQLQSWDCNKLREAEDIRKKLEADPVSGGVWGRSGPNFYLLDWVNEVLDLIQTCDAIVAMSERWPNAEAKVIEYAANGPTIMALLRRRVSGLIPNTPLGSKSARVIGAVRNDRDKDARNLSMQVLFNAGNVYLPHPFIAPKIREYIFRICAFPSKGVPDDDIDMTSQGLMKLQPKSWQEEDEAARDREMYGPPPTTTQEVVKRLWQEGLEMEKKRGRGGRSASYRSARG